MWIEYLSEFGESYIKNYNESDEEYFFAVAVQYLESLHEFTMISHFYLKE